MGESCYAFMSEFYMRFLQMKQLILWRLVSHPIFYIIGLIVFLKKYLLKYANVGQVALLAIKTPDNCNHVVWINLP